jgi:hypothetical protein
MATSKPRKKVHRVTGLRVAPPVTPTDELNEQRVNDLLTAFNKDIIRTNPQYQCSACGVDMLIAGRYDKSDRNVEGQSKNCQFDCYACGKRVSPKLKEVSNTPSTTM